LGKKINSEREGREPRNSLGRGDLLSFSLGDIEWEEGYFFSWGFLINGGMRCWITLLLKTCRVPGIDSWGEVGGVWIEKGVFKRAQICRGKIGGKFKIKIRGIVRWNCKGGVGVNSCNPLEREGARGSYGGLSSHEVNNRDKMPMKDRSGLFHFSSRNREWE